MNKILRTLEWVDYRGRWNQREIAVDIIMFTCIFGGAVAIHWIWS